MSAPAITITLDHSQRRIVRDRTSSLISGFYEPFYASTKPLRGWDETRLELDANGDPLTWVDPVTGRLMLTPAPYLQEWQTTGTGIYERLAKSDFTFADAAKWVEDVKNGSASLFLALKDSEAVEADRSGVTTTTWPKNRPFYISWFPPNWGDDKVPSLECGWNSSASDASGVSIKVRGGGTVEVWKDGLKVGEGSIVGKNQTAGKQTAGTFVSLLIIPVPQRELIIVSNQGGGFVHAFDDIDDSESDPVITAASKFWFKVPSGKAEVEVAPIRFPSSGYRCGIVSRMVRQLPAGEAPLLTSVWSEGGYGTVDVTGDAVEVDDPATVFLPVGTVPSAGVPPESFRIRLDLSGDGEATPYVMSGMAEWPTETGFTDGGESVELQDYALSGSLDVSEHPACVRFGFTLKSPDAIDPGDLGGLKSRSNGPIELRLGTCVVVDGVKEPSEYGLTHQDETDRVGLSCRDRWKLLEQYRFSDPVPLDGLSLKEAFEYVATSAGFDLSELDVEDDVFELPSATGAGSSGDWNVLIEAGDTAAEWLERLRDTYAGTWFLGIVPTPTGPVLRFRSPEDLDPDPVCTIYIYDADALADGIAAADSWRHVARSYRERRLEPEANDVWVTGFDPKTRRPIVVHQADYPSQDITLPPTLRPENSLLEIRKYGYQEPALTTQAAVERACDLLFRRLTPVRKLLEVECEIQVKDDGVPLWRGDLVTVYGRGDWRVVALSVQFVQEPNTGGVHEWREARYTLEKVEEGTAMGTGGRLTGSTLMEMFAAHQSVSFSKSVLMGKRPVETLFLPVHTGALP